MKSALLGNGLTLTAGRDLDGRLASLNVAPSVGAAVQDLAFAYDPNSNILSITDGVDAARTQTFQYDKLNRLKQACSSGSDRDQLSSPNRHGKSSSILLIG